MGNELTFLGKVALVTGSSRGIGKAIALNLATKGADMVINYVHNQNYAEETANAVRQMGRKAIIVRANIGKIDHIHNLFRSIESEFGRLDFFISNAASGFNRPGLQQRPEGWDHTINVNARAFLFATQQAAPLMMKNNGGVILAITSQGSTRVMPDYIAVGASKAALESLVRYLAVELAQFNIVVNAISPGIVETDALKHFQFMTNDNVLEKARSATPAGRLVTPQDIADLVVFLCSPQAAMIRGQVIVIDGGLTLPISV